MEAACGRKRAGTADPGPPGHLRRMRHVLGGSKECRSTLEELVIRRKLMIDGIYAILL